MEGGGKERSLPEDFMDLALNWSLEDISHEDLDKQQFEIKFRKERGGISDFSSSNEREHKGNGSSVRGLLNTMFSWSLHDIFNKNLLKNEVTKIPTTFTSLEHYLGSYTLPLIEEVHADLCSSVKGVSHAPFIKILSVKEIKPNKQSMYEIVVAGPAIASGPIGNGTYQPKEADIFVVSEIRPRHVSDLTRTGRSYIIASVIKGVDDGTNFIIKPSQTLAVEKYWETQRLREPLFAVFLLNMTTYNRIWMSLDLESATQRNTNIINNIISYNSSAVNERSSSSLAVSTHHLHDAKIRDSLNQLKLNDSQANAVLDCISVKQQHQKYSVNLIWGPPGTGKTKTISTLLQILLTKNCRTITCTPTNTAVVEVASRLVKLVRESSSSSSCALGNVVLFGNEDRMKIDVTLSEIFLDKRVNRLFECFMSLTGWRHCFNSMINFLEECVKQYKIYMAEEKEEDQEDEETYKMTFKEFVTTTFHGLEKKLSKCMKTLCQDLPRVSISEVIFRNMILALQLIKYFGTLFCLEGVTDKDLEELFEPTVEESYDSFPSVDLLQYIKDKKSTASKLWNSRFFCLQVLRSIHKNLNLPNINEKRAIQDFCLKGAVLIFCTASSSFRLHNVQMEKPLEFLVVDEAAQLKECESLLPLQLSGIEHAIFIGDEYQLPALVKSQISDNAAFGRSLFERLSSLGYEKHLLNVQYRMHPSISKFPVTSFYNSKISDGPNVACKSYETNYLSGPMYGAYSFINIKRGKETTDKYGRSQKNMVEVAVVLHIIKKLFEGRVPGIYRSWEECHQQVTCYRGANYISVTTLEEAQRRFDGFQGFKNREPEPEPEPESSHGISIRDCAIYLFGVATGVLLMFFWHLLV